MIGTVIMEVGEQEMVAALQFYFNKSLFNVLSSDYHKATVLSVRQRSSGKFVIEFEGQPEQGDNQPSG